PSCLRGPLAGDGGWDLGKVALGPRLGWKGLVHVVFDFRVAEEDFALPVDQGHRRGFWEICVRSQTVQPVKIQFRKNDSAHGATFVEDGVARVDRRHMGRRSDPVFAYYEIEPADGGAEETPLG